MGSYTSRLDVQGTYFDDLTPLVLENIVGYLDCYAHNLFIDAFPGIEGKKVAKPCKTCIEAVMRGHSGCLESLHMKGGKLEKVCDCRANAVMNAFTTYKCVYCEKESYNCTMVAIRMNYHGCIKYLIKGIKNIDLSSRTEALRNNDVIDLIRETNQEFGRQLVCTGVVHGVDIDVLERANGGPIPYSPHLIVFCLKWNARSLPTLKYLLREQIAVPTESNLERLKWVRACARTSKNPNPLEIGEYFDLIIALGESAC
jgi:hypothetical protein